MSAGGELAVMRWWVRMEMVEMLVLCEIEREMSLREKMR